MSNADEDDRQPVSLDEAIAMMPAAEHIHTFRAAGFAMIGADWPRGKVIECIKQHGAELSGPSATNMKHGLVVIDDRGPLFIETK